MPPRSGNDRFNAEAAAWDANPDVHRASDGALQAILAAHPSLRDAPRAGEGEGLGQGLDVLEIGCGTGLLTLRMAPYVRSIVAIDAAEGMIDALKIKLEGEQGDSGIREKITPLCLLLEDPEDPRLPPAEGEEEEEKSSAAEASGAPEGRRSRRKKFDLITSHLVLHHIADVRGVLATMLGCLRPGGEVALTDYADNGPGARRFHPEARMGGVEHPRGIDPAWLAGLLREVGFAVGGGDGDDDDDDGAGGVLGVDGAAWTMDKEVERWPGEWGGLDGGPMVGRPAEGAEVVGFPFLLARGRRRA